MLAAVIIYHVRSHVFVVGMITSSLLLLAIRIMPKTWSRGVVGLNLDASAHVKLRGTGGHGMAQ